MPCVIRGFNAVFTWAFQYSCILHGISLIPRNNTYLLNIYSNMFLPSTRMPAYKSLLYKLICLYFERNSNTLFHSS